MKLNNVQDVKKWLRNLSLLKKELELEAEFYKEIADDFDKLPDGAERSVGYRERANKMQRRLDTLIADTERLFGLLDENERLIMVARYIKLVKWDYIEFHVYYSRRHAVRVHDNALLKLVGQTVGEV